MSSTSLPTWTSRPSSARPRRSCSTYGSRRRPVSSRATAGSAGSSVTSPASTPWCASASSGSGRTLPARALNRTVPHERGNQREQSRDDDRDLRDDRDHGGNGDNGHPNPSVPQDSRGLGGQRQ